MKRLKFIDGRWVVIPKSAIEKLPRYIGVTGQEYGVYDTYREAELHEKVYELTYYIHTSSSGEQEELPMSNRIK